QARALALGREGERDPTDAAAVLPGGFDAPWPVALLDEAAGVALELVAPALAQLAGDRQEPAPEALGGGEGVPQVVGAGGVAARGVLGGGGLAVALPVLDAARHGGGVVLEVRGHG